MVKKSLVSIFGIYLLFLGSLQVTDAALVAKWTFNEGSGATAFDSSGNGNDGTLGGNATFITNGLMGAVELDGSGDYVSVPYSASLDVGSVTMVAWIRIPSPVVANGMPTIVGKPINTSYSLWYAATDWGKVKLTFKDSAGSTRTGVGPVLATDTWLFIAATFPDTTYQGQERFTLYIDNGTGTLGIYDAYTWNYTAPLASSASGYEIGGTNGNLGMIIDEIQVYDHVMGVSDNYVVPAELQAIYNAGPEPAPPPAPDINLEQQWTLFSIVGYDQVRWDGFQVTDGTDIYNVLDVNAASWIQQTIYYFDSANQQFKLIPADDEYLYYYHGYYIWSNISGLGLYY